MNFKSDNVIGVHPQIMEAILQANVNTAASYGNDEYSQKLKRKFSEIFEKEVSVYLTNTGTAANSLGLSALVPPYGGIYCHTYSHINTDESGAPELFTNGAKLIPVPGKDAKVSVDFIQQHIQTAISMRPHMNKPSCVSISQATEYGTIYKLDELQIISELASRYMMPIHMDGARFANSLTTLKCSPAQATWKVGVDVMSFGATKNGAMAAEAIIFFDQKKAIEFDYYYKRSGQMMSKMRFFACQFLAYLENDLWLNNANHANQMANNLAAIFSQYDFKLEFAIEANEIFVRLPTELVEYLYQHNFDFYKWSDTLVNNCQLYRFVTSCFTTLEELQKLDDCIKKRLSGLPT